MPKKSWLQGTGVSRLTSFAAAAAMAASPRVRGPRPVTVRRRLEWLPGIARVRLTFASPPIIMPGCFAASACAATALAPASDKLPLCQTFLSDSLLDRQTFSG